jgi:hypothetical protein
MTVKQMFHRWLLGLFVFFWLFLILIFAKILVTNAEVNQLLVMLEVPLGIVTGLWASAPLLWWAFNAR